MNQDGKVEQLTLFSPDICSGKMCQAFSAAENHTARISASSSKKPSALRTAPYLYLDLRSGFGTLLEPSWEMDSPSLGVYWILNTGPAPLKGGGASSLSQILEARPHRRYFLSKTACLGILRRAQARGKELPPQLKLALMVQAGLIEPDHQPIELGAYHINQRDEGINLDDISGTLMATRNIQMQTFITHEPTAFACNQRDEVRDLHDVAGAVQAHPGMKQQTFISQTAGVVTKGNGECFLTPNTHTSLTSGGGQAGQGYPCVLVAGFCAGAAPTAGSIGYQEECAPTLKAGESGTNMVPSILCLNDQGGQRMDVLENQSGTLRAQMDGHPPLVMEETYCISGNIIDRETHNGGNGLGIQVGISYSLTTTDHHAIFSRQRSDLFLPNDVTATQSSRQYKDATDLVYQQTVGTLVASDKNGPNNQYVGDDKCIIMPESLIRRLTPLECERLMGLC